MQQAPNRRDASKIIFAAIGSTVLPFLKGCGSNVGGSGGGGRIEIIDNPEDVLGNSRVQEGIRVIENAGYYMNLSRSLNPPYLVGEYNLSGEKFYPQDYTISPGTFRWRNQTQDNHIETDYTQIGIQSGRNIYGEIIRGEGNLFTVYSRLKISQGGCGGISDFIIDGEQLGNGDINAVYLSTIIGVDAGCTASEDLVAGAIELSPIGYPKRISPEINNLYPFLNSFR